MIRPATTLTVLVLAGAAPAGALAAPGDYDPSFSGDGIAVRDLDGTERTADVDVSPDGAIVVAGESDALSPGDFAIARISPNGQFLDPDPLETIADFGGASDTAKAVSLAPDGGIVVAGFTDPTGDDHDLALARFQAEGGLDQGFGVAGKQALHLGGEEVLADVAVDRKGRILAAGWFDGDSDVDPMLVRFTPDGTLDPTFGGIGFVTLDLPELGNAAAVAIDRQDRIVIAGTTGASAETLDFLVARFDPDGVLDPSFADGAGWRRVDLNVADQATSIVIAPDGRIVVAGIREVSSGYSQFGVARLLENGDLDASFSDNGWNVADFGDTYSFADGVAVAPDGKVVVAGARDAFDAADLAVVRFGNDGLLDPGFGNAGVVVGETSVADWATGAVIDPRGRIVLAVDYDGDFAAFRLEGDPVELDTTITAGPADGETIAGSSPEFSFSSSSPGVIGFECSSDGAEFAACASPRKLAALDDGAHSFAVRAVNNIQTRDPSPATRNFRVDSSLAGADPDPDAGPGGDPGAVPAISLSKSRYRPNHGKKLRLAYTISVPGKVKAVLKGAAKKTRRFKSLKKTRNHGDARTFRLSFALKSKPKQRRRARRRPLPKGPYKLKLKLTSETGKKATASARVAIKKRRRAGVAAARKVVVRDKEEPRRGPTTDIIKATAEVSGSHAVFTLRVPDAQRHTKGLSTLRLKADGDRFYASTTNHGQYPPKALRGYEYVKAKIGRKGNTVSFRAKLNKLGSPDSLRWQLLCGGTGQEDYAPNKKFARLRTA